jgi:hypothetical protein
MSRYRTSDKNSSKLSSRLGIHEAIVATDNLFSEHTKLHLLPDAYSTLVVSPQLILADVVSNNATLPHLSCPDKVSSVFFVDSSYCLLIAKKRYINPELTISKQFLRNQ